MLTAPELHTGASVHVVRRAAELPSPWDSLCTSFLQHRALLQHYEATNPCGQRYYLLSRDGRTLAGAVVYTIVQNLFTFLGNLPSPVTLNVVGLPASISPAGIVGEPHHARDLLRAVFAKEAGITVALNLSAEHEVDGVAALRMLPHMVFRNRFVSLDDYRDSLRSPWRRRMKRSQRRFCGVRTIRSDCAAFTLAHHALYLKVLDHATERLETLGPEFFRGLPRPIELVSCYHGDDLVCWRIVLLESRRLSFVLGGHAYASNHRIDAYFNSLLGVLSDGMERGVDEIDLGQTAEDAKARVGAQPVETRMLLRSSNPVIDRMVWVASPLIAYRRQPCAYRVFRNEEALA